MIKFEIDTMILKQFNWNNKNGAVIYLVVLIGIIFSIQIACKKELPQEIPSLVTINVTDITSSSITSGGLIFSAGGLPVQSRGICLNTKSDPEISDNKTDDGTGTGSFTSTISGLMAGTTYYIRAYAINSAGIGYGNQYVVKTTGELLSLTTTDISSITSTTAMSGGNITSDGGSAITARGVCWSTSTDPTIADSKTSDGTGTGIFTSAITGLTAETGYYVRAYATNAAGTSYGNQEYFISTPGSGTIPVNGLVAYYPINENVYANDLSGNNNNGTVHGATLTVDRHGVSNQAYNFNGVDNYIEILYSSSLNLSQQISISFWAKFETSANYYWPYHIIEKYGCWGTGQREADMNWGVETPDGYFNIFTLNYEYDRFYHFVMIYDGSKLSTYVDGVLKGSVNANGTIMTNLNNIYIGKYTLGDGYFFDGTLDDIRIYNRALTDQEISALYNE
jgi:hypothetical protein